MKRLELCEKADHKGCGYKVAGKGFFETLGWAREVAEEIFQKTGIIVAVEPACKKLRKVQS